MILNVKQLNKIMKLYYFYALKALQDGQGKIKRYYGICRVKKQLSRKMSIEEELYAVEVDGIGNLVDLLRLILID